MRRRTQLAPPYGLDLAGQGRWCVTTSTASVEVDLDQGTIRRGSRCERVVTSDPVVVGQSWTILIDPAHDRVAWSWRNLGIVVRIVPVSGV